MPEKKHPARRRHLILSCLAALALPVAWTAVADEVEPKVTPPSGESWLAKMKRPLDTTSLGRAGLTGRSGGEGESTVSGRSLADRIRDGFDLTGADLYRLDCRSCHGAKGQGVPPEILPLTQKVRQTSIVLQEREMKRSGQAVDEESAEESASAAQAAISHRLEKGGAAMPPFDHFSSDEVEVLLGYLDQISGVPETRHRMTSVHRSVIRVGEHLVKGTCQICHDASEKAPFRGAADRRIPTLAAFPRQYSIDQFVEKARHGQPVELGRGRMPHFVYLHPDELIAAYLYLAAYPAGE